RPPLPLCCVGSWPNFPTSATRRLARPLSPWPPLHSASRQESPQPREVRPSRSSPCLWCRPPHPSPRPRTAPLQPTRLSRLASVRPFPPGKRPWVLIALVVLLLLAAAIVAVILSNQRHEKSPEEPRPQEPTQRDRAELELARLRERVSDRGGDREALRSQLLA